MSKPTPKRFRKEMFQNCEQITGRYLESLGFRFIEDQTGYLMDFETHEAWSGRIVIYHQAHGGANPDFTLYENGRPIAVLEHEDINYSDEDRREMAEAADAASKKGFHVVCRGKDPYEPIRRKIKSAARQLRDVKDLPTMIVIHDYTLRNSTCDWSVQGAMFGSICISMPPVLAPDGSFSHFDAERAQNVYGEGGKFVDDEFAEDNKVVSAVAVLDSSHLISSIRKDPVLPDPSLEIYCTPTGYVPWPELFGPNDTVHRFNRVSNCMEVVYEPKREFAPKKDSRSQTQKDIDAIMELPGFRNDGATRTNEGELTERNGDLNR